MNTWRKTGIYPSAPLTAACFGTDRAAKNALIFYHGAKVEYTAYVLLMYELAENGMDVFIIKMPCNMAFFGVNKADDIFSEYSYAHMYLGGHSLGGVAAAIYAANEYCRPKSSDGSIFMSAGWAVICPCLPESGPGTADGDASDGS